MSETTNNPQPSEPPVGGSGGGTAQTEPTDIETADAKPSDPPTSGSGGGS
jgi:hypothetical protein